MTGNNNIFRQKSIDRISSPEQLNDYLRVCNPSVWMVLLAVIVLLVGTCVWGICGHLDTKLGAVAIAENNQVTAYIKVTEKETLIDKKLTVNGAEYTITEDMLAAEPIKVDQSFSDYALHVGKMQVGEWVYAIKLDNNIQDGIYEAQIIIESVSPMSFIFN